MSDVKYPDTPDRIKPYTEVDRLHDKIKQLEADSGNWEAAYKTCAKSEDKLIEENQRLREAIEFEINQPMQIARQQERLQKALKGE